MKKCPFCGEEIQDAAKKCRFCGEWLNLKVCPICGESIPANSTVCKFCNENIGSIENEILDKNDVGDNVEKNVIVDEKNVKVNPQSLPPLKKLWADYSVLIIIVVLLLGYSMYRKVKAPEDSIASVDKTSVTNNQVSDGGKSVKFKVDTSGKPYTNSGDLYDSKYELELVGMNDGYILKNDLYSCKISEKNISKFVSSVNKGVVDFCEPLQQREAGGKVSLGVFVDNSYATDNGGRLDASGPEKRIKSIQKILNMYKGNDIVLYLGFLYATKENENLSEVINNRIIKLSTDNSSIGVKIKVYSEKVNPLEYFDGKDKISIKDYVSFVLDYSDCVQMDDDEYSCYNVESLNNQIGQIYKKEFDKKELHSGNPMIEYFADKKIQGYFNLIDDAYILTDGQFEITDNYINLKKVATQMSNFSGYTVSNFYLDSYRKNQIPFEKFWNNNALKGGLGGINCGGIDNISFIGLVGGNPGFTNFMHEYFSNKMFTGCNVTFEDY